MIGSWRTIRRAAAGTTVLGLVLATAGSTPTPNLPGDGPDLYAYCLRQAQQIIDRAGTDIGRTRARMTLTGVRWTDLLVQLTESAYVEDEVAEWRSTEALFSADP